MGIFVQTDGRFAYANPAACAVFGAERPEDLVGSPVLDRFPPDVREHIRERIRRLNEHREAVETSEQEFLRLDGAIGLCRTSAIPFVHQGKNGALVFIQDATDQQRDREAVKARDELLQLTGRLAKVGGWEFDATTLKGTWTEEVARIHDLDPALPTDVALGMSFYTSASRQRIEEAVQQTLSEAVPYDLELEMLTAAGNRKWVRTKGFPESRDGHVVRVRGIFQDITETKQAQLQLAQEKERLSVTLQSIGDGVITTDTRGRITLLNPVAERLTGWRADEATGRPLREVFAIFNELTRQPCEDPVAKVLKTGLVVELANHTCLVSRNGVERAIADSGAPILDAQGTILGVVLVFRDMTEQHKLAEAMHRAQSLEAIGVLAGGIAHDFNNLLTGIFGNLSLAQNATEAGDTVAVQRNLSRALGIFERARALTHQLLTFSKGGTPVREVQRIDALVHRSATFALSGSNVSLEPHLDADLWACSCDRNQIGQVVDNLVINAKQAMPEGGVVKVSARNVVLDATRHAEHRGRFVNIRISDHGPGIPKEIQSRIFEPFFSTKSTGHGLGLATVYSIVQRHDGWIEVESEPGAGATFDIYLPAHLSPAEPSPDSEISAAGHGQLPLRILVMDDEEYLADLAAALLESLGHEAVAVPDGQAAIAAFLQAERDGAPFSLCILDLTIPGGMGGIEAARAMRAIRPDTRFAAASGYSDDPVIAHPADHGFHGSLSKPYLRKDLVRLLDRILSN
jgi:PAS domain S-box-containing protein